MRIGALSALTGLSRDAIRFYEKQGLIRSSPAIGDSNTYRHYGDDLPERLRMITDARAAGMSIADLKFLLDCMEGDNLGSVDINDFLDERIEQLHDSIRRSRNFLKVLKSTRDALVVPVATAINSENTT